ncbi:Astra associated protein 1 Asa1 [Paramarasmius palmivorus]|uniref:ASTRA-associated protein 1 n=1 Tax=Paramarasmius palmivorus TaxID=297713 RepID=A0AAW0DSF3_9AGAR
MASSETAPSPIHLLRSHSAAVSALHVSTDNERIYSGDSSGLVVCTSTRTLRAMTSWKAHTDGLLGVEEMGSNIITHGRDNKIHVWGRVEDVVHTVNIGGSASLPEQAKPLLKYSMDVNALNYCRFSLMPLNSSNPVASSSSTVPESSLSALLAVPNLVESSQVDIWSLPSRERLHAAIGYQPKTTAFSDGRGSEAATGILMSIHLFTANDDLQVLMAYENGSVHLRRYATPEKSKSVEGKGWELLWSVKLHNEAIMAMRVSRDNKLALTVSADHLVGRYDLSAEASDEPRFTKHQTKHPGNGAIAIRDDGRVCAIGGWDGRIRLFTTKKLKPLGTLKYHKSNCQAVEFARSIQERTPPEDDEDEEMTREELERRGRWLVGGAADNRISIWELMNFEK